MTTMPSLTIKGSSGVSTLAKTDPVTLNPATGLVGTAVATGDFIFLVLTSAGSGSGTVTPAPPTGWTVLVAWQAMGTSTTTSWAVYAKKRAAGETTYSLPQSNLTGAAAVQQQMFWIDGANAQDVPNWTVGSIGTRAGSGGTFTNTAPSVTTTVNNSAAFVISAERTTATEADTTGFTVSGTGWTKQGAWLGAGSGASSGCTWVGSKGMATAGATGSVNMVAPNTQTANGAAFQVIIPPTPDAAPTTVAGTLWDGSALLNGHWYVATGVGNAVQGCAWAGMIWPGYASIDEMLADPFFYVSHRGGSNNYPEMSLQGYTQSALRGYGALEVSLARTSDGVWFGLHDNSLDRTSLGTAGTTLLASSMTWAQVQTYDIRNLGSAAVDATHRPYMRLETILDAYLKSHVIFIDPKYATSLANRNELIAILQSYPNWQSKIIAKYVPGNSTNSWLVSARSAGFYTNAMFYAGDNFLTYGAQADLLGMQYDAASTVWTSIKSLGKPVVAHVCANTTQVAAGQSQGARGAIVSGPVQVPRVTI